MQRRGNRSLPLIASLAAGLAAAALAMPAFALPMVNGKKCAGSVSEQVNPNTGVKTRSCRTVDGEIATETVKAAKKDAKAGEAPAEAAAPKKKGS
jgi:hypothetical protein